MQVPAAMSTGLVGLRANGGKNKIQNMGLNLQEKGLGILWNMVYILRAPRGYHRTTVWSSAVGSRETAPNCHDLIPVVMISFEWVSSNFPKRKQRTFTTAHFCQCACAFGEPEVHIKIPRFKIHAPKCNVCTQPMAGKHCQPGSIAEYIHYAIETLTPKPHNFNP